MWFVSIPFYLLVAGIVELAALLFVSIVALVRLRAWGWYGYTTRVRHWAMFATLFLVSGCTASSVFEGVAYGRMYETGDPTVHFFPVIPFGQWALDDSPYQPGRLLNGTSMLQMQALWAVLAAATWGVSILLYRAYLREQAQIREEEEYWARRRAVPDLS